MSYIVTCNLQPIGRFQGQATDVDIARKEIRNVKIEMVFFFLSLVERERINNLIMNLK
jgi:ATP-dependent protease ClpP protease subunit